MDTHLINSSMSALAHIDQDVAQAFEELGAPPPRHRTKGFETFLSIIVSQQISTEVAQVINDGGKIAKDESDRKGDTPRGRRS